MKGALLEGIELAIATFDDDIPVKIDAQIYANYNASGAVPFTFPPVTLAVGYWRLKEAIKSRPRKSVPFPDLAPFLKSIHHVAINCSDDEKLKDFLYYDSRCRNHCRKL